ncbi:MAG: methylmalonyl-CoA mutase small subunit [Bacteroidales bacterium]|nr:methylmalonyl-CoA mutase small subunit [Bacteroidales bacterium]
MADNSKLFSEFPPVSTQAWMDKIIADLKGADFEKKLVWKSTEGFKVNPFYRAEDLEGLKHTEALPGEFPYVRGTKKDNNWLVRQDIEVEDVKAANAKALDILNKGVDSLGFTLQKKDVTEAGIATLLEGICPKTVELNFKVCVKLSTTFLTLLTAYYTKKGYDLAVLKGSVNFDPVRRMLTRGKEMENYLEVAEEVIRAAAQLPKYRVIGVNAIALNNAGAYISQELGYALAWGAEYITKLTDKGLAVDEVAKRIKFNLGVGQNYFMEIAKFRAARMLWAQIVDSFAPQCDCSAKMKIHAETSIFNKTIYDAHVNLLRTQTEAMSAALGGVDSLTVTPFDTTYKASDEFSERIARNQQLLLKEESHFSKVVDAAGGSYYIENLTASIAEQAWNYFLTIDEKGGFLSAVKAGIIQDEVAASGNARRSALASRREDLLGTNQFPNFNETALSKIETTEATGCGCQDTCPEPAVKVLDFKRDAADFEALRLATEEAAKRPKAFMLTIGKLSMRLARAQFSGNFFAVAGYEIIDNLGFPTVEEGVAAARNAGADIIVLCSSDEEYVDYAPIAKAAIGNDAILVIAGAPACMDELKTQGIENFIHVRSNVLDTLKAYNTKLGIAL